MAGKRKPSQPRFIGVRAAQEPKVLQLKIRLLEVEPPIWRRFQILNSDTLADLRLAVQIIMGWQDSHLDEFTIGRQRYAAPQEAVDIEFEDEPPNDARGAVLAYTLPERRTPFYYTYDFGDTWEHELIIEKVLPLAPRKQYPLCLEGARACPPEDSGGAWGYQDLLAILADPEHEEHEEQLEWLGGKFDPEKFSVASVNRQLRQYFKPARKRR